MKSFVSVLLALATTANAAPANLAGAEFVKA